jgi:hypothetical protein
MAEALSPRVRSTDIVRPPKRSGPMGSLWPRSSPCPRTTSASSSPRTSVTVGALGGFVLRLTRRARRGPASHRRHRPTARTGRAGRPPAVSRRRVIVVLVLVAGSLAWVAAKGLSSNLVYYQTPTELLNQGRSAVGQRVRLGGWSSRAPSRPSATPSGSWSPTTRTD